MYITYSDIETYLGITLTAPQQAQVTAIIEGLEAFINTYCNRQFTVGNYVETYDGNTDTFTIANPPVTAINSITVDGSAVDNADIYNYGSFIRLAGKAGAGLLNVAIDYEGGLAFPDDLKFALIQWTANEYQAIGSGGQDVESVQIGQVSINYDTSSNNESSTSNSVFGKDGGGLPPYVANVLEKYKLEPMQTYA